MPQPKGKTGNPYGRPKGTPNKATATTREFLTGLIESQHEQIVKDLQTLTPKDRLMILERFMSYCMPKLQSMPTQKSVDELVKEINEMY